MNHFNIQEQLDFLDDYVKREMDNVRFDYFVVKPGGRDGIRQRPKVGDSSPAPSVSSEGELRTSAGDGGPLVPRDSAQRAEVSGAAQNACSANSTSRKSKAVDIVDPATGEKVRF